MIVVTGSTGTIGTQLLPLLLAAGEEVRVIARDPARLPRGAEGRIEVAVGLDDNVLPHHYAPVSAFLLDGWA